MADVADTRFSWSEEDVEIERGGSPAAAFDPDAVTSLDRAGLDAALDEIAAAVNPDRNKGNAETLRRYWSTGEGSKQIRWHTPGDHNRCVRLLMEHGKFTEEQAHGYCSLLEKRTTGQYPAQHAQEEKGGKHATSEQPPSMPALVTIPGVDILAAGTWALSTGRQTFTRADLEHAVQAAACPAVGQPLIKIGHLDDRFAPKAEHDGEPAIGRVTNMRLSDNGTKITGDLAGMPGWLAGIAASAFPRRSVEGKYGFTCQIGHQHPFVITALALLGVTPPGVGVLSGLDDIAALYGVQASGPQEWHTEPTEEEGPVVAVTEEDVRRAYYAAGTPSTRWITELQMAPTQLIVADDADGKLYRVPFSIEAEAVRFGDPDEISSYDDVAAARGTGTVMVYATAEESRAVIAAWDAAAAVRAMGDDPSPGAIKAMFAIPGDTKSDSKLPHHDVSGGKVGGPNPQACSAAMGALNGARGGLKGVSDAELSAARAHIMAHMRSLNMPGAQTAATAGTDDDAAETPDTEAAAGEGHGPYSGEHTHPHTANGDQGGDQTHDHMHRHDGDGVHAHAHDPVSAAQPAAPAASTNEKEVRVDFTPEQLAAIRAKLGKSDGEEVTPAEIAAAFTDAPTIAASAGPMPAPNENLDVYLVEASVIKDWRKRAEAGDAAVHERRIAERDTIIAKAIDAGKIPQARKEHWQAAWNADPEGTRTQIERLASGLVPMGPAVGAAGMDADGADFEERQILGRLYPEELKAGHRG